MIRWGTGPRHPTTFAEAMTRVDGGRAWPPPLCPPLPPTFTSPRHYPLTTPPTTHT